MTSPIDALPSKGEGKPAWLLMKRGLYERPDHRGYTGLRIDAGRFTLEEAVRMVAVSNGEVSHIHEDSAYPLAPRADRGTFAEVLAQRLDEATAAKDALYAALSAAAARLERLGDVSTPQLLAARTALSLARGEPSNG